MLLDHAGEMHYQKTLWTKKTLQNSPAVEEVAQTPTDEEQ